MQKLKILVFPCGSEIGLEIHRSLRFSTHIELFGASSVNDHGKFIYKNYFGNLPYIDDENFIPLLVKLVKANNIDAIYPAMDKVIWKLKLHENDLGCKIIASPIETTEICLSKKLTYQKLTGVVNLPKTYNNINTINSFPIFIKPNIGYGSRGVFKANSFDDIDYFFKNKNIKDYIISEFLTGQEYTIDCFTDRHNKLRFCGPRLRQRISNGISVNTTLVTNNSEEFFNIAEKINNSINLQGAWFFQLKRANDGLLTLMEIADRLGGSSSLYRCKGINFALLSIFDAFNINVEIIENDYQIELDRALDNRYKTDFIFSTVYVDLDDCLIVDNKVNTQMLGFLYNCINKNKQIILITKHIGNVAEYLEQYKIGNIFNEVIHLGITDKKINYIKNLDSVFIDDSFSERKEVFTRFKIPVFSPDMIEAVL
ncbi:MAG: ATP-grasp domain-containing protein [bacterium]